MHMQLNATLFVLLVFNILSIQKHCISHKNARMQNAVETRQNTVPDTFISDSDTFIECFRT